MSDRITYLGGTGKLHVLDMGAGGGPNQGVARCGRAGKGFLRAMPYTDTNLELTLENSDQICASCAKTVKAILAVSQETKDRVIEKLTGKPAFWNTPEQTHRREQLRELMERFHRGRYGDYDDTYDEFEATFFGDEEMEQDRWQGVEPVPRYASCAEDETYGMIHLCETLTEALNDQAGVSDNGEYLNVPAGIYDLDQDDKRIQTVNVVLTVDSFNALGGIVAMTEQSGEKDVLAGGPAVNHDGILCDWDELRAAFPLENFKQFAMDHDPEVDGMGYWPDAGY